MSTDIFNIPLKTIDGKATTLNEFKGKPIVIVNVASKCGLTPQYEELEALYKKYKNEGLAILGFPANDFGSQEPGTNQEIQEFCNLTYGVSFPMFEKIIVTGPSRHPLYEALTTLKPNALSIGEDFEAKLKGYGHSRKEPNGILWNFEKFLIGKNGEVLERFSPNVKPSDSIFKEAINKALY